MDPKDQQALIQFFGTVHAQAKQTDQMIVGSSQFLKPVSPSIQNQLENALRTPQVNIPAQPPQPVYINESKPVVESLPNIMSAPVVGNPTVSNNNLGSEDVINILKEINLSLVRIGNILEKKNESKKSKVRQPD